MNHWLFKSEPESLGLGKAGRQGRRRAGMGRRAQLPGPQPHEGDEAGRSRLLLPLRRREGGGGRRRGHRRGASRFTADDPRWQCVDIRAVAPFPRAVSLEAVKAEPKLADMVLVKNSRLSVQPVTAEEWRIVCAMGGYSGWRPLALARRRRGAQKEIGRAFPSKGSPDPTARGHWTPLREASRAAPPDGDRPQAPPTRTTPSRSNGSRTQTARIFWRTMV